MARSKKSSSDRPQPITDHLEELRWRIFIFLGWFVVLSIGSYFFVDPILDWLAKPVGEFVFTKPTEAFLIRFKMAIGLGVVFSFPILIYELWRFIELALVSNEKKMVSMFVPFSFFLFAGGVALALFIVSPLAAQFLLQFGSPTLRPMISIQAYLSFLFWMVMGFGILFQVPVVILVMCRAGIWSAQKVGQYRGPVVVILLILAAFLTPGGDFVLQIMLASISYFLFEVSILMAKQFEKRV